MAAKRIERLAKQYLWWGALLITFVFVLFLIRGTWTAFGRMQEAAVLKHNAELERDELLHRKAELDQNLDRLKTPRGIEDEVRARFQLVKPGEEEFVLVKGQSGTTSVPAAQPKGFWDTLRAFWGR